MFESEPPVEETKLQRRPVEAFVRRGARLEWREGDGLRSVLVEERTILGSASDVGIVIQDPAVSRLHVELEPRTDGLWVRDLGSRNGTFLDGIQILAAKAPQGSKLCIGETEIFIEYPGERRPVELWPDTSFGRLLGASPASRELFAILSRVAPLDAPVLVQGETGTGKELVAHAIHDASPRANKPFVVVDCAALPESLLDAELFGHTRGAFTGAVGARVGAIEAAEGGTVFLDEIGELPMAMQPKLLRVLESRAVRRVGDTAHRTIDVRFISATHRDLLTMVNAGEFREDLYFRLAVVPVKVPPLRERQDDVELLVDHFWRERGGAGKLSPELLAQVRARPWRGNVRELRNFVERLRVLGAKEALALATTSSRATGSASPLAPAGDELAAAPASASSMAAVAAAPISVPGELENLAVFDRSFKDFREAWIDDGERRYVRRLLERHGRNVAAAARDAGVDRTYIYRLIRKHGL